MEVSLRGGIAGAEDDDLRVEIEDAGERREDRVGPLLLVQARDDADERNVGALRETELLLQRALAGGLAVEVLGVEARGERRVGWDSRRGRRSRSRSRRDLRRGSE